MWPLIEDDPPDVTRHDTAVAYGTAIAAAFTEAGATLLIATRLDTARRLGGILAAADHLVLTEAGVGPGAADGLVAMTPALLAGRLNMIAPPLTEPRR